LDLGSLSFLPLHHFGVLICFSPVELSFRPHLSKSSFHPLLRLESLSRERFHVAVEILTPVDVGAQARSFLPRFLFFFHISHYKHITQPSCSYNRDGFFHLARYLRDSPIQEQQEFFSAIPTTFLFAIEGMRKYPASSSYHKAHQIFNLKRPRDFGLCKAPFISPPERGRALLESPFSHFRKQVFFASVTDKISIDFCSTNGAVWVFNRFNDCYTDFFSYPS